jgi:hypothetical protein
MNKKPTTGYAIYFEDFDKFDPDASYVPTPIVDALAAFDFSSLAQDELPPSDLQKVLGIILREAFRPASPTEHPPGYVRDSRLKTVAQRQALGDQTVKMSLMTLESLGIVEVRGSKVCVEPAHKWLPQEQQHRLRNASGQGGKVYSPAELSRVLM